MKEKELLENINENLEDLHKEHFFGGRKRRERHNFFVGILMGIGLSLMIGAGIQLYVDYNAFQVYGVELAINNLTIQNLTLSDRIEYQNLALTNLHLLFVVALGFLITTWSFLYYRIVNRNLFNHVIRYSYKLDKTERLPDMAERIACVFRNIKSEKEFKWIGGKVNYDPLEERVNVLFYHKIKKLLMLEYPNKLSIDKGRIVIFCQTSDFGEQFGLLIEEFLKELKKNKIIKELKRESRV